MTFLDLAAGTNIVDTLVKLGMNIQPLETYLFYPFCNSMSLKKPTWLPHNGVKCLTRLKYWNMDSLTPSCLSLPEAPSHFLSMLYRLQQCFQVSIYREVIKESEVSRPKFCAVVSLSLSFSFVLPFSSLPSFSTSCRSLFISFFLLFSLVFTNLFFYLLLFYITYVRWPRISNFAERVVSKDGRNLGSQWCIASLIQFSSDDVRQCVTITVRVFLTDVATHIEVQGWIYLVI